MFIIYVRSFSLVRIFLLILFFHVGSFILPGQYFSGITLPQAEKEIVRNFNDWSYKLSTTITKNDLKDHIATIASYEFGGRETGTPGSTKAAAYIASHFRNLQLKDIGPDGPYSQKVNITFTSWKKMQLSIGKRTLKFLRDFISFPQFSQDLEWQSDELIFLGYGIDDPLYSDYTEADVTDKVIMVFDGEPMDTSGQSLLTRTNTLSDWSTNWQLKSEVAHRNGAKLLIIISNDLRDMIARNRNNLLNRITQVGDFTNYDSGGVNTVFLSPVIATQLLGEMKDQIIAQRDSLIGRTDGHIQARVKQPVKLKMEVKREVLSGQNVVGFIEGKERKEEVIILSAHYDHIGKRAGQVYYGADDNASGTAAVLEIAEALVTAQKMNRPPMRSVLCLLVTGEEKGLLGSAYYSDHPLIPLDQTLADVNIDMIGRRGKEYSSGIEPYIYVIGSDRLSLDLHLLNEEVNQQYSHLLLDYKYNDEKDPNRFYYRSDHYNFAKKGIPSIFFFNGVHADYHRLSDTLDKIDFPLLEIRARHIFHTIWELANRKERIRPRISPGVTP